MFFKPSRTYNRASNLSWAAQPHRSPGSINRLSRFVFREADQLWLDLSDQKTEDLDALAADSSLPSQLKQSATQGVYLNLDNAQQSLEYWADVCRTSGKVSLVRVPSSRTVFARQSDRLNWSLKRLCDWSAAVVILTLLSPLLLLLALLIKVSSPGPVFFRQWRVGQNGQLFRIFKFRTMTAGAERQHRLVMGQQQGLNKCENDPRVTPLGRFMRKSSLDELPQLLNVLTGEMSLVGPRPWALYDAVQLKPSDRHRLRALPGITGLWQVSVRSKLLDIDRVTGLDLHYIKTWSLINDLKILLKTLPSVIQGRGAC